MKMIVLGISKISGIGCFATEDMKCGERIHFFDQNDTKFVHKHKVDPKELWLHRHYGVETKKGWWRPLNFMRMSVCWYINHSETPNTMEDDNARMFTVKDIKAGEELTVDYRTLDDDIDNTNRLRAGKKRRK